MNIKFGTEYVTQSLALMLMGMAGIFVVMGIIMGVIVLLNKFTDKSKDDREGDKKK